MTTTKIYMTYIYEHTDLNMQFVRRINNKRSLSNVLFRVNENYYSMGGHRGRWREEEACGAPLCWPGLWGLQHRQGPTLQEFSRRCMWNPDGRVSPAQVHCTPSCKGDEWREQQDNK